MMAPETMRNFIFLLALGLGLPVHAGDIYKCTEAGRTIYREKPCSGAGTVLALPPAPSRDPDFEARQARARSLAANIDARNAQQAAIDKREADDAAWRQQRQSYEQERRCASLRARHEVEAESDARAIARNRGRSRIWAQEDATSNARKRAKAMASQCPG